MKTNEEYSITVRKARNGWVVISEGDNGEPIDVMVVKEDEELGGMIAAAIAAQRLEGRGTSKLLMVGPFGKVAGGGVFDQYLFSGKKRQAVHRKAMEAFQRAQNEQIKAMRGGPSIWTPGLLGNGGSAVDPLSAHANVAATQAVSATTSAGSACSPALAPFETLRAKMGFK